ELRAGTSTQAEDDSMEAAIYRSPGHCMVMGTASTMGAIVETLGMTLPGGAAIPGADSRRKVHAEDSGRAVVELVRKGIRPSDILTRESFDNAIRMLLAAGGSTNAIIHLTAIAGRAGIDLPLEHFNELSESTPVIVNLKPGGKYLMEDLYYAGGVGAVLKKMSALLNLDCLTVNGKTLGHNIAEAECYNDDVVLSLDAPLAREGGLTVLKGTLAPDGAVIKHIAASPELMKHSGRAVVFENPLDLKNRIDNPDLEVSKDDILVMKGAGPVGGPGMPEAGFLPLPKKLLAQGVRDMVRISDARMSGTAFGTIVLHVSPESTVGGPLALVQTGDLITLDVRAHRLDLEVDPAELERRRARLPKPAVDGGFTRGYGKMYAQHITQAQFGCDFDFLIGKTPVETHVDSPAHAAGYHTG
ncbi:MAG: dihydroxy-acid dehydratase, partial [Chloroflexi bacterium]|nr:dihydroxy-acid dehydratase [Chloroflexota bacterium]